MTTMKGDIKSRLVIKAVRNVRREQEKGEIRSDISCKELTRLTVRA